MADIAHVPYEVTHQAPAHEPDGKGGFHKVMRVHFTTPEGVSDHVEVPNHLYTAENVHAMIMDQAHHIARVHNLPHSLPAELKAIEAK